MASLAPSLDSLPDELLGACLSYLAPQDGRYVTLVSKRFRRLFYEQPSLWCGFAVVEPQDGPRMRRQLEAKLALLQRVAPLVSAFRAERTSEEPGSGWNLDGGGGHPPLSAFLQLLPPSLTALELVTVQLPPPTVQLLRRFTALRSLSLHSQVEAAALPAALLCMPRLEQLYCSMQGCPDLEQLTQLSQLRHLDLWEFGAAGNGLRPPTLAALPQLESFQLRSWGNRARLAGTRCANCRLGAAEFDGEEEPLETLSIGTAELGSLQALLAAAVRPTLTLQALELNNVAFSAAALHSCTQLTALRQMRLFACQFNQAAAAALFAASQRLVGLDLIECDGPDFELHRLQLPLQLKRLCFAWCCFELPSTLAQLTSLEVLDVSKNDGLELSTAAVHTLCSLPHLRELGLPGRIPEDDSPEAETRRAVKALVRRRPGLKLFYRCEPYF